MAKIPWSAAFPPAAFLGWMASLQHHTANPSEQEINKQLRNATQNLNFFWKPTDCGGNHRMQGIWTPLRNTR
jgi:hypothetical protein